MRSVSVLVAALVASVSATPAPLTAKSRAAAVSMMADTGDWTITSLSRACNAANTSCTWSFGIYNGTGTTPCTEVVTGSPATQANGGPATCGVYTVTSGWSGQFGAGQGFTTFAVVNQAAGLIIYPAYTDNQVASGAVVTPDQSYTPQTLG